MKIILIVLLLCLEARAVTRYVRPTGAGTTCTAYQTDTVGSAANTIAEAVACMAAGDITLVNDGTYAEAITDPPSGTSWGTATRVAAVNARQVTVQRLVLNASRQYIIFEGFVVDNNYVNNEAVYIAGGAATGSDYIRILNNEVRESKGQGVLVVRASSTGIEILDNAIHDNGQTVNQNHGVYLAGVNSLVEGNEIYSNCAYGMQIYNGYSERASNNIVRGNIFRNNGTCGDAPGFAIGNGDNNLFYNNIVRNNTRTAIEIAWGTPSGNKIYNNTVYANTGPGILVNTGSPGTILANNIFWDDTVDNRDNGTTCTANMANASGACIDSTLVQTASPFTSAGTNNFTLAPGNNKAIGNAIHQCSTFTIDFTEASRDCTVPIVWDIGAYAFVSATPSITLSTPVGGERWVQGTTQRIDYTASNISNVDITFDPGNDGTFEVSVVTSSLATLGTYSWTVPSTPTTTGKIKVKDSAGATNAVSPAVFEIAASAAGGSGTVIISNNTSGDKVGIGGVTSALLGQANPTFNYGTGSGIGANKFSAGNHVTSVLRFTTSSIPSTATVTAAELGLYLTNSSGAGTHSINFRNNKRTFVQSQATWNIYSTGNSWGTAGGLNDTTDRDSTVVCNMVTSSLTSAWYTCSHANLTALVQNWVDGDTTNEGLHLERHEAGNDSIYRTFGAVNPTGVYLSVTYTTATPTISVIEPTTGDHLFPGKTIPIRWTSQGVSGNVQVLVSRDGGYDYDVIDLSYPFDRSDFSYLVPDGKSNSSTLFKIVSNNDTAVFGISSPVRIAGTYR